MKYRDKIFWICMASAFVWVLCFSLWHFLGLNTYYIGQAQLILCLLWYIHQQANGKAQNFVSRFFLFVGFNNLLDEIFFDPTAVEWSEYIMFALFLIYSFWKRKKY